MSKSESDLRALDVRAANVILGGVELGQPVPHFTRDVGAAMTLLFELEKNPYLKWRITGSFFRGSWVIISAPDEDQQQRPLRDASIFATGSGELPEAITRAALYAMFEDVGAICRVEGQTPSYTDDER